MTEPVFKSELSIEEINENFKDVDLFSELMEGLTEALAFSKGDATAKSFTRKNSLPSVNVKEIRSSLNMTQRSFAKTLGVSARTVEAWESGKSTPTPTAKKLMHLIEQDHSIVNRL